MTCHDTVQFLLCSGFLDREYAVLFASLPGMRDLVSLGCWSVNDYQFNSTKLAFPAINSPGALLEVCQIQHHGRNYKYVGVYYPYLYCMNDYSLGTPSDKCDVQCGNDTATGNNRTYWPGYVCGASNSFHVNVYQLRPGQKIVQFLH